MLGLFDSCLLSGLSHHLFFENSCECYISISAPQYDICLMKAQGVLLFPPINSSTGKRGYKEIHSGRDTLIFKDNSCFSVLDLLSSQVPAAYSTNYTDFSPWYFHSLTLITPNSLQENFQPSLHLPSISASLPSFVFSLLSENVCVSKVCQH